MLGQAQRQQEHGKRCKITATANEIRNADDEDMTNTENTSDNSDKVKSLTPTEAIEPTSDDDSKTEDNNNEIRIEDDDDDEASSKEINIDPKTYCKLGHFHLLLDDYAKGKCE